jgi:hypothetical protein
MVERPIAAFFLSTCGGVITLASALITINSWFALQSTVGGGFSYSSLGLGSVPSGAALPLFVIGVGCGIMILVGAVLQLSGKKLNVKAGSIIIIAASLVGVPSTFFGMIFGGLLSVVGSALGLSWKPQSSIPPRA